MSVAINGLFGELRCWGEYLRGMDLNRKPASGCLGDLGVLEAE